jgi:hypothetical protein
MPAGDFDLGPAAPERERTPTTHLDRDNELEPCTRLDLNEMGPGWPRARCSW